jgi:hypothetical protein
MSLKNFFRKEVFLWLPSDLRHLIVDDIEGYFSGENSGLDLSKKSFDLWKQQKKYSPVGSALWAVRAIARNRPEVARHCIARAFGKRAKNKIEDDYIIYMRAQPINSGIDWGEKLKELKVKMRQGFWKAHDEYLNG